MSESNALKKEILQELYWNEGMSQYEVAEELNVSRSLVEWYMQKYNIPTRSRTKTFDSTKVEDLSYVLGVLLGDAYYHICEEENSGYVRLQQKREEFAKSFYEALETVDLNPRIWAGKGYWYVEAYSMPLVDWFRSLSVEAIREFVYQMDKGAIEFIRGFYESEGDNYIKKSSYEWIISIYNSQKEILELVDDLLQELGFLFHLSKKRRNMFQLRSYSRRQNTKFMSKINPCIKNNTFPLKYQRWSKRKTLSELKKLHKNLGRIPKMKDASPSLWGACQRYYGGWTKAVEALQNEKEN